MNHHKKCGKEGCTIRIQLDHQFCGLHGHYKKQQKKLEEFMK